MANPESVLVNLLWKTKEMFNYQNKKLENIPCNLCGVKNFFVLAKKSVNGLNVKTCLCKNCGLIFINPRMTKSDYDDYYKNFYRKDRNSIKKGNETNIDLEVNFNNAKKFGAAIAEKMSRFISNGLTIDVGSSTGGVLCGLKEKVGGLEIIGIEPSPDESEFANKKGIKTINCLFEDFDGQEFGVVSNILCVQSLNHVLDPKRFLKWSFDKLKDGGHIILAVKNFRHQCRRAGRVESAVQIDHPYMFTPEALKLFVESVGFKVVYVDIDEGKGLAELEKQREEGFPVNHIKMVGEKIPTESAMVGVDKNNQMLYSKLYFQFWKPFLRIYNLFFYSKKSGFLRKILRIRQ